MVNDSFFSDKKILLIDKERKNSNDRTWCFWEKEEGLFEKIVYRKWDKVWFYSPQFESLLNLDPYQYKMIRGIDFYRYCQQVIDGSPNVHQVYVPINKIENHSTGVQVAAGDKIYNGRFVFNSILFQPPTLSNGTFHLLQHFMGWVIETPDTAFNPGEPVLMDFRPHQSNGTTFVYVMPFSETKALVEYTVFSPEILSAEVYRGELKKYMRDSLQIPAYEITEEEFGVIPMTNFRFNQKQGNILNIGTAGGQTKPSSGYTFRFIQKQTSQIVSSLKENRHPFNLKNQGESRFRWFDSVMLNILQNKILEGRDVFADLFSKNTAPVILEFLDNETQPIQELKIMKSVPAWPFMKAGLTEWLKSFR